MTVLTKNRTPYENRILRQQRRFWALLRQLYDLPREKELAYSDWGITSLKKIGLTELAIINNRLQGIIDRIPERMGQEEKAGKFVPSGKEYHEDWRTRLFPEDVIAFGKNSKKDIISKKQQDFIIFLAMRIFKNLESFLSWLKRWTGSDLISFTWQAIQVCRGLVPMGERLGLNIAPPSGTIDRQYWDYYQELKRSNENDNNKKIQSD